MPDSIQLDYNLYLDDKCDSKFFTAREHIKKVTVVSNGFTCQMDADHFFKIIHEAFQW
jgi:hypothetical protein